MDVIQKRRSIRRYTDEDVTEEQVKALLEAAMAAPSGRAADPWEFIVVRDAEMRQRLSQLHQYSGMVASAPVAIVVCGDESRSEHWVSDCSAATQNILLQATSLGLGGVWVAVYPRPDRESRVKELLGIPAKLRVLCMVAIGHPAEQKQPRTRFNPAKVHYEKY